VAGLLMQHMAVEHCLIARVRLDARIVAEHRRWRPLAMSTTTNAG
jgi:hypothetical protein